MAFQKFIIPLTYLFFLGLLTSNLYAKINHNDDCNKFVEEIFSNGRENEQTLKIVLESNNDPVPCLLQAFKNANHSHRRTIGNLIIQLGADAIPVLEQTLLGEDEDLAANSAILLGEIGKKSIPSLQKVFQTKKYLYNLERKMEAAYALGRIGSDAYPAMIEVVSGIDEPDQGTILLRDALIYEGQAVTPYMIEALNDDDPVRRIIAAIVLGNIKDESSVPALIKALNDKDKAVCTQVAWALSRLGNKAKEATPFIIEKLKELETKESLEISEKLKGEIYVNFQSQAIEALDKIGADPNESLHVLIRYTKHRDSNVRSAAIRVLGKYKKEKGARIDALVSASNDIKGEVRKAAIESFEGDDAAHAKILRLVMMRLNDTDPSVRGAAAKALGKFKNEYELIIPQLIIALKDKNAFVRSQSASSLGDFGEYSKNAIPDLIFAVHDENRNVRLECVKAIGRIGVGSNEVLMSLKNSFTNEIGQIQIQAANSLQNIGLASVPVFVETLKHKDEEIRKISAEKLGNINPKAIIAISDLTKALKDINIFVREKAVRSLGNIGPASKSAIPDLTSLLDDENYSIKKAVIDVLGKIGPDAAVSLPNLINILDGNDDDLIRTSINTIGKFGSLSKDAVPDLVRIVESDNNQLVSLTINALGRIGPAAADSVPVLIKQLEHSGNEIRRNSAQALGSIGYKAKDAIPYLLMLLKDEDQEVKYRAADSLADITKAISDNRDVAAIALLEEIANQFKTTTDLITERYPKNEHFRTIVREITHLKTLRVQNIMYLIGQFSVKKHPIISLLTLLYILWAIVWLIIFWRQPLNLLPINTVLNKIEIKPKWLGGMAISLRYFLFIGFLNDRPRVLDAWVKAHVLGVREQFVDKHTVRDRKIHISVPVERDRKPIADLQPKHLRHVFKRPPACLLIWGEGGSGKTSLACQIAKWAMSEASDDRICQHLMIPILIEHELDTDSEQPLADAIKRQLQILTKQAEPIPDELLERLLRQQRILVIVDHLSEMSEPTRAQIKPGKIDFPANALLVTSRLKEKEKLGHLNRSVIKPLRVAGPQISIFIDAYLKQREKRDLFDDPDFFDGCSRLSAIVGDRDITVLLAKLYAEQMILVKEGFRDYSMPDNIPDLMIEYINRLNSGIEDNRLEDHIVHRDAKALAWECIQHSLKPGHVLLDKAIEILIDTELTEDKDEAKTHLDYLEKRLRLIQIVSPTKDRYRFILDPLSEYLAGLYLVEFYAKNKEIEDFWHTFLIEADNKEGLPAEKKGFFLALRDCCIAKKLELNIPDFLEDELANRAGLDPEELRQWRLQQRIRVLIRRLNSSETLDRENAISELKGIGPAAKQAVPALINALEKDGYEGVRKNAAEALRKIKIKESV